MKITVGTTELTVTGCYAYRYQNGKLVLKIEVPQTEITHDSLKALIKGNTGDIVCEKDDGTTETFSGFVYTLTILDKDETYFVEVECVSETERKLANLQNAVTSQNETIATQNETIAAQEQVIGELNDTILELLME